MKHNGVALFCGMLFGMGLSLSHMIDPNKVLNFLDVSGDWDPSLIFVMLGALSFAMIAFRGILKRPYPLLANQFMLARPSSVDASLVMASIIFGMGWGLSGYCPGPAVAGLGLLSFESLIMVISIYLGFFAYNRLFSK
jgi:uncharacterized membrane protein YedE/YeeE